MSKATKVTATITLDSTKFEVSGILGEREWETTISFEPIVGVYLPSKTWTEDDVYLNDEQEVETYLWEEVIRVFQKYNSASVELEEIEIEDEIYDDE